MSEEGLLVASRMLSDAELEQDTHLHEADGLDVALSPEMEELLDWLEGSERSVQEVVDQMRLLGDDERDVIVDHLAVSTLYGRTFVRELGGAETRFRHRRGRPRVDPAKHRREVPEGFQKVMVNITRLQALGRNVFALTPELLPEDVLRMWPAGRPLPELVVVNMDHAVPRVSVVRRLPSAGGIKIERGALKSMTSVVAKVLGKPDVLRQAAVKEGLAVEHPFEKVDVSLTEIAWSPQLELGELLYDWEEVQLEDEEAAASEQEEIREAQGITEAAGARLHDNGELVSDLSSRLTSLEEGWADHSGAEAREANGRIAQLQRRRSAAGQEVVELERLRAQLDHALGQEEVEGLDAQLSAFQERVEAMEHETADLARAVAEEERGLEAHHREVEENRLARVEEMDEEEEAEASRRVDKAMADPAERSREEAGAKTRR